MAVKLHIETDQMGDLRLVRVSRHWYGKPSKGMEILEVTIEETDEVNREVVHMIEIEPDESICEKSARHTSGMIFTLAPELYGDPDARLKAGKKAPVPIPWGEWHPA